MNVDFYRHTLSAEDADSVASVLATPFLTTGAVSRSVEERLCSYFDVPHTLLTNSWTNGATALLLALGIGPGDEVIVPAMTFVASANVAELVGAKAVLVDVDPETLLVTPAAVSAAITPRTKAVMPVHLYGQMVDIEKLRAAVDKVAPTGHHIAIVEDCAHCFEGRLNGYRPGRFSDAAVFSFYATKNVTCGEGGAIIFSSGGLYEITRETRTHGMSAIAADRFKGGTYNHWDMMRLGLKANLPDLLAALLPRQIETIDTRLEEREELARRYDEGLDDTPLRRPMPVSGGRSAWHLYTVGVAGGRRDEVIASLNAAGISVTVNYRALPELHYYAKHHPETVERCPFALQWGRETLSLPFYPGLPKDQQNYVIDTLRNVIGESSSADKGGPI